MNNLNNGQKRHNENRNQTYSMSHSVIHNWLNNAKEAKGRQKLYWLAGRYTSGDAKKGEGDAKKGKVKAGEYSQIHQKMAPSLRLILMSNCVKSW